MSGWTWCEIKLRTDQVAGIAAICEIFKQRTGKRLEASTVASEAIDSGLPLVRQRYDELARANLGKPQEVTSLEARDT